MSESIENKPTVFMVVLKAMSLLRQVEIPLKVP